MKFILSIIRLVRSLCTTRHVSLAWVEDFERREGGKGHGW